MLITHQTLAEHLTYGLSFPPHAVLEVYLLLLEMSSPGMDITKGILTCLPRITKLAYNRARIQTSLLQSVSLMPFLPLLPWNSHNFLPMNPVNIPAHWHCPEPLKPPHPKPLLLLIYLTHSCFFIIALWTRNPATHYVKCPAIMNAFPFIVIAPTIMNTFWIRADVTGVFNAPF